MADRVSLALVASGLVVILCPQHSTADPGFCLYW